VDTCDSGPVSWGAERGSVAGGTTDPGAPAVLTVTASGHARALTVMTKATCANPAGTVLTDVLTVPGALRLDSLSLSGEGSFQRPASAGGASELKAIRTRVRELAADLDTVVNTAHGTEIARAEHRLRLAQLAEHALEEFGVEEDARAGGPGRRGCSPPSGTPDCT